MKTSMNWLREYTDLRMDDAAFQEGMIRTGTAVERMEPLDGGIQGVVVGRVLSCVAHENSDHLHVCMVDAGQGEPLQIVCGAPNVREGQLVPVALVGSTLPGGQQIKAGKLRGVASYGMLCSATELQVPQELYPSVGAEGLLIFQEEYAPGTDVRRIFRLDDTVVDVEVLANRPDCLSVWGLAREAAAVFNIPFRLPAMDYSQAPGALEDHVRVRVENTELCPRYAGKVITDVRVGPSPLWMRAYLHAAGMRSINNIVDITNFVMLETGHPMHAFDLEQVRGQQIIVRKAKPGEHLTTLDGKKHALAGTELLICDQQGPTGLAGIMGGLESEITEHTKSIFFECAAFDRTNTRISARALGIRTEASGRFERGVSPSTVLEALNRACHLVELLGAGKVVAGHIDIYPQPLSPVTLHTTAARLAAPTGVAFTTDETENILKRLHFEVVRQGDALTITAPAYRQDIEQEADLCEEVLRLAGYERIPSTLLRGETPPGGDSQSRLRRKRLTGLLTGLGYDEIINFSFFGQKQLDSLNLPAEDPRLKALRIRNPLGEDTALMRTTLMPDMLKVLSLNMNHGNQEARLYEFGTLFDVSTRTQEGLVAERPALSMGCYGNQQDFYSLRDALLTLLSQTGVPFTIQTAQEPFLHSGRSAVILSQDQPIAVLGEVHPDTLEVYDMPERAWIAQVDLEALWAQASPLDRVQDLPRYPAVNRDIALVLPEKQQLQPVMDAIRRAGGKLLEDVQLFDVYRGAQLGEGRKSAAFSLTFRAADHTLDEQEIAAAMDKVVRSAKAQFDAEVRS